MRKNQKKIVRMIAMICAAAMFGTVIYSAVAGILGYF